MAEQVADLPVVEFASAQEWQRWLARHHADPDSAFWGWNDIWLDPLFRRWSIEALLPNIGCRVLAVQGHDDQYGTLAQVEGIADVVPQAELLALDDCGHRDGLLLCPEGAATLAGLRLAQQRGLVRAGERIVLFNCADGHKYPLRPANATLDRTQPIDLAQL